MDDIKIVNRVAHTCKGTSFFFSLKISLLHDTAKGTFSTFTVFRCVWHKERQFTFFVYTYFRVPYLKAKAWEVCINRSQEKGYK